MNLQIPILENLNDCLDEAHANGIRYTKVEGKKRTYTFTHDEMANVRTLKIIWNLKDN